MSSRPAIVAFFVVVAIVVVGVFDTAANWGKAYGNVSINGIDVGGKTSQEMHDILKSEYGSRVSHAQITIYADEQSRAEAESAHGETEINGEEIAEQLSYEDSYATVKSWSVDALTLKANIPYDEVVNKALAAGREDGGVMARIGLLFGKQDINMDVAFDDEAIEALASEIDLTIGDPRLDTTVVIEDGVARVVEGHSGTMVDRDWLKEMLSRAMIFGDVPDSFVATASVANSRITDEQANEMATSINHAISEGVVFSYKGKTWLAGPAVLGDWTNVSIVGNDGSWHLEPSIVTASAIPVVVDKLGAEITSDDVIVTFENKDGNIMVHTAGTGNIPEVSLAVDELQKELYGENGLAWRSGSVQAPSIEVVETDRPETLSFDDALNAGIITVIGEFTTEFSDIAGTENRNHNIKLAADTLNNGIIEANGGTWSFNDRTGNTDENSGYWTAGSIVQGELVDSVGGGICQVATTVFNSILEAGFDVLERHNHTMYIASYPTGRDAAVDYPSDLDLMWKNGLASDVLLRTSYTDTSVTAKLYSVYTGYHSEYEEGNWEEGEKYKTLFEEDDSLAEGTYYEKTTGENGSKISVIRTVLDDAGKTVRVDSFQSVYEPKDQVYVIGPGVDKSKLKEKASKEKASAGA